LASQNKEFTEFWSRVCKFAGATIRFIKSENDITSNLSGYMLTDQEFPDDIKLEAHRKGKLIVFEEKKNGHRYNFFYFPFRHTSRFLRMGCSKFNIGQNLPAHSS
jgi:hypothetical protein